MNDKLLKLFVAIRNFSLVSGEDGQDLVEYALVVALIAFGAVVAMSNLSTEINSAFTTISSDLASALA
jgi:pilus assembly protein Flp/PilA